MRTIGIAAAVSIVAVVSLLGACADETTAPTQVLVPVAISQAQRTELAATVSFAAREESLSALADREAAAAIGAALARLVDRVTRDDRVGAQRAVESARAALREYRARAASDAFGLWAVEAMRLALDHAELLAAAAPATSRYTSDGLQ